jgi:DNA-binding transcriptional LysR family regulator
MIGVELRHLRCLVAIADEQSFSLAAERLNTSQPAISQLLKRLEDILGHRLIERDRATVRLTAVGEVVMPAMRQALTAVDRALETTRRSLRGELGQLRVGISAPSLYGGIPEIIRRFRTQRPGLVVEMALTPSAEQPEALLDGRLDVAFGAIALEDSVFSQTLIGDEVMHIALPRWHPLARRKELGFEDLAHESWILPPATTYLHGVILELCRKAGFAPRVVVETADFTATLGLVLAGTGVTLIAESFRHFTGPGMVLVPLGGAAPRLQYYLTTRAQESNPTVLAFVALVRSTKRTALCCEATSQ